MEKVIVTGDGRIFERNRKGNFQERGGNRAEVTKENINNYDKYIGVKSVGLSESMSKNRKFTEMMMDKADL